MMPEIHEIHQLASGEAKPKGPVAPRLGADCATWQACKFRDRRPTCSRECKPQALEGGKKKIWLDRSDRAEREKAMRDRCSEPQGDERVSQRSGSCLCA
jgi:hypothetical protein